MARIEVNHKTLRDAAASVTAYCAAQDRRMRAVNAEIKELLVSGWQGPDAQEFGNQWEEVDAGDAAVIKLRVALTQLEQGLTACANEYQAAQENAYNLANSLPK